MSKNRLVFAFLSVVILSVMVLMACAPSAPAKPATPPATTTPPAVTTPPVTPPTPPTPPAPPAAPPAAPAAPVAPPKTSYDAETYTNSEYGFFFLYPSTMKSSKPKAKYAVFEAADAMQVPSVSASVLETAKAAAAVEEALTGLGGSDIKTVSSEPVTLADGKTKATYSLISWKSSGYAISTYSLAVEKGDKTISVAYSSLTDMIDPKVAKEVVYTLTFK